jgi:RNA polymerase sigma-70 factor (ECF subfamily)
MPLMRFEEALEQYHDEIYRFLFRLSAASRQAEPDQLAADLTQDTFERAYKAYSRLEKDSNVRAWLYAIAANLARDRHRQRQVADRQIDHLAPSPGIGPEKTSQLAARRHRLLDALEQLPFKQRQAVTLRYFQELEYQDIGQILACSAESARANVYQGIKKLRSTLSVDEEEKHG